MKSPVPLPLPQASVITTSFGRAVKNSSEATKGVSPGRLLLLLN